MFFFESQRYGRNKSTMINKSYIESGEYRRKFDRITDDANLARLLYNKAKEMLYHRSGTEYEDFNSCYSHRYRLGIIICHNGGIYTYSSGVIVSRQLYRLYCSEFIDRGLSECEARIQAIKEIERNNEIVFEEVK